MKQEIPGRYVSRRIQILLICASRISIADFKCPCWGTRQDGKKRRKSLPGFSLHSALRDKRHKTREHAHGNLTGPGEITSCELNVGNGKNKPLWKCVLWRAKMGPKGMKYLHNHGISFRICFFLGVKLLLLLCIYV